MQSCYLDEVVVAVGEGLVCDGAGGGNVNQSIFVTQRVCGHQSLTSLRSLVSFFDFSFFFVFFLLPNLSLAAAKIDPHSSAQACVCALVRMYVFTLVHEATE